MRRAREITAEEENFRTEPMFPENSRILVPRKDPVEPEPVGTYIAMCFRIVGYHPDCDGSLMAKLERVDEIGEPTGWCPDSIGLYPDTDVVIQHPSELFSLADVDAE